jgi:hypothetical protein
VGRIREEITEFSVQIAIPEIPAVLDGLAVT